ncbi:MAG: Oxygen-independent coproporphyrinogen III oxidase [uncultured bacterium (gcode 4)]|uniref:Oxygen-independent coproporphyrinogen III oxidase n=1 Tax=uncultured bacterium (gcode 4) TaxID=1234023 RepID=K2AX54_9BACT|nr:MAG: Oxygen-independent coproporphyrinogen III oxidase [uncultured bacterium (gcode 4)]
MFYYIHIPFCKSKCKYCSFASFAWIDDKIEEYLVFLKKEIREYMEDSCLRRNDNIIESIYFWGGTPSVLSIAQIDEIISIFREFWNLENTEMTLEMNPENVSEEYAIWLKKIGINRISIWVQSLNNKTLQEIWRSENKIIFEALNNLKKGEFENIWADFIIGLPYVLSWEIKKDLEKIINENNNIKHVSLYMLENWIYPKNWAEISFKKEDYLMEYEKVVDFLKEKWFEHYEISNFAKTWAECRHNKSYWNHSNYRGFGLNASSFVGNKRFTNGKNFSNYYWWKLEFEEILEEKDLKIEKIMFGLRTFNLDTNLIENKQKLDEFIKDGLLEKDWNFIKPTISGIAILDFITQNLI